MAQHASQCAFGQVSCRLTGSASWHLLAADCGHVSFHSFVWAQFHRWVSLSKTPTTIYVIPLRVHVTYRARMGQGSGTLMTHDSSSSPWCSFTHGLPSLAIDRTQPLGFPHTHLKGGYCSDDLEQAPQRHKAALLSKLPPQSQGIRLNLSVLKLLWSFHEVSYQVRLCPATTTLQTLAVLS